MGHIFWNNKEIPIPEGSHINHSDGRVYIYLSDSSVTKRQSKTRAIGHATSEKTMLPNYAFRQIYPELWKQYYGDDDPVPEHILHAGLFVLTLSIGYKTGLYKMVTETYGPDYGNLIMDCAMYSILDSGDVSQTFQSAMRGELIFSRELYSDSYLSSFFKEKMDISHSWDLRNKWIQHCGESGITESWISIVGSNNDYEPVICPMAENDPAKSEVNSRIISCMYAINAVDGAPITYNLFEGSKVDSKAFLEIAEFLNEHGISIKGVILDKDYCAYEIFELLHRLKYEYVVMMKSNTNAYTEMVNEFASTLPWNAEYLISGKAFFGISASKQLFEGHNFTGYCNLFYDGINSSLRKSALLDDIIEEQDKLEEDISRGEKPAIPESMKNYLEILPGENNVTIRLNYKNIQNDIDTKGFSLIATSRNWGAKAVNRIFDLRDSVKKQYRILKTQLGYSASWIHYSEGIENRFLIAFVASCIRSEIQKACEKCRLDTGTMISEIDKLHFVLLENGNYVAVHDETTQQKDVLEVFSITPDSFDRIMRRHNSLKTSLDIIHECPYPHEPQTTDNESGTFSATTETERVKRKAGRPLGRKNNKTLEREALKGLEGPEQPKEKRKPGRPKGSKNKKTLELEASQGTQELGKRGPGRPKGSKNKPKIPEQTREKRRVGRPVGSKDAKPRIRRTNAELGKT